MWDNLESVWKTADEAPNCDAYVVSISYYNKSPDGSFGSWKKIIFYNTSVGALLPYNEKMRYVFDVFKENQDEVALLWRLHPLIKATVESMRP